MPYHSKAAVVLLLALIACAGKPITSGIEGRILIGPQCPVMRIDQPCPDRPYQATVLVKDAEGGRAIKTFTSNPDGTFHVPLAEGSYMLEPQSEGRYPIGRPVAVAVQENEFTQVNISYDSGIR